VVPAAVVAVAVGPPTDVLVVVVESAVLVSPPLPPPLLPLVVVLVTPPPKPVVAVLVLVTELFVTALLTVAEPVVLLLAALLAALLALEVWVELVGPTELVIVTPPVTLLLLEVPLGSASSLPSRVQLTLAPRALKTAMPAPTSDVNLVVRMLPPILNVSSPKRTDGPSTCNTLVVPRLPMVCRSLEPTLLDVSGYLIHATRVWH
jgi:hypothetical protein